MFQRIRRRSRAIRTGVQNDQLIGAFNVHGLKTDGNCDRTSGDRKARSVIDPFGIHQNGRRTACAVGNGGNDFTTVMVHFGQHSVDFCHKGLGIRQIAQRPSR